MKLSLIGTFLTTISMSCMGCSANVIPPKTVASEAPSTVKIPEGSHFVWCSGEPANCFDSAALMCGETLEGARGQVTQHSKPGKWHQVAEVGMTFPAMIQNGDVWRMLVVCDEGQES